MAVERLVGECMQRGGNAIIAMRFDQGEVSERREAGFRRAECVQINTFSHVCAYGTAVVAEMIDADVAGQV